MFCDKCGKQINDNAAFCPHCGCSMSGDNSKDAINKGNGEQIKKSKIGSREIKIIVAGVIGYVAFMLLPSLITIFIAWLTGGFDVHAALGY